MSHLLLSFLTYPLISFSVSSFPSFSLSFLSYLIIKLACLNFLSDVVYFFVLSSYRCLASLRRRCLLLTSACLWRIAGFPLTTAGGRSPVTAARRRLNQRLRNSTRRPTGQNKCVCTLTCAFVRCAWRSEIILRPIPLTWRQEAELQRLTRRPSLKSF